MFVDTDTNKDDLANRGFFPKFIDMAAFIPGMYGYAPTDVELYETEDEKEQARRKMLNSMGPGVMTVDEWLQFFVECIITKVVTFLPYPILDHGIKTAFKAFVEAALVHLMFSRDVSPPATMDGGCHGAKEQDNPPPVKTGGDYFGTKEQNVLPATIDNGMLPDVSRDVSPSATADGGPQEVTSQHRDRCPQGATPQYGDGGCQGATSQHGDGGRQGAPSQHGGEGHHGAKEGGQEERRGEKTRR